MDIEGFFSESRVGPKIYKGGAGQQGCFTRQGGVNSPFPSIFYNFYDLSEGIIANIHRIRGFQNLWRFLASISPGGGGAMPLGI